MEVPWYMSIRQMTTKGIATSATVYQKQREVERKNTDTVQFQDGVEETKEREQRGSRESQAANMHDIGCILGSLHSLGFCLAWCCGYLPS